MAGDATKWFDLLYRDAGGDPGQIPWASQSVCPVVVEYLAEHPGHGPAVVVGCGIGDDSEAVAAAGYDTVGFDVAAEAIEWCRRRFPESPVDYRVADLFSLPDDWHQRFDLVIEVKTTQSLPPDVRPEVLAAVASMVAPGGRLLIVAVARAEHVIPYGPPWAVSEPELGALLDAGLQVESFTTRSGGLWADLVAVYRR
ncbi:MAG: class I SAM-dependent methyltransferase [Acidimicrobiia bacterium]|nr:class I SAM-dependent methyltransferase [Acidimicrobiia bacterium]